MNLKLYNAVATQLRGAAMESLALVDLYLTDPTMVPDHSSLVEEIIKHTQRLTAHENAMVTLQQYFGPKAPSAAAPPPAPAPTSTTPITEEELRKRSPTFRKAEQQKARRAAKKPTKTAAPKTKAPTAASEKS